MATLYHFSKKAVNQAGDPQPGATHLIMETNAWGIGNITNAHSNRVFSMPTYRGFVTQGLGRNPSTKIIKGVYAPARGSYRNWRTPIDILLGWQGLEIEIFSPLPSVSLGVWILEKVNIAESAFIGESPQKIDWTLNFLEVDRGDR